MVWKVLEQGYDKYLWYLTIRVPNASSQHSQSAVRFSRTIPRNINRTPPHPKYHKNLRPGTCFLIISYRYCDFPKGRRSIQSSKILGIFFFLLGLRAPDTVSYQWGLVKNTTVLVHLVLQGGFYGRPVKAPLASLETVSARKKNRVGKGPDRKSRQPLGKLQ